LLEFFSKVKISRSYTISNLEMYSHTIATYREEEQT